MINTWDKTETLPRKVSRLLARSRSGEVGAEVVLLPDLPTSDWESEVGRPGGSRGEAAPLLTPLVCLHTTVVYLVLRWTVFRTFLNKYMWV